MIEPPNPQPAQILFVGGRELRTVPKGWGTCWIISDLLFRSPQAFTPGYAAVSTRDASVIDPSVIVHEFQHYLQSHVAGFFYLPGLLWEWLLSGYQGSIFEEDAREAQRMGQRHEPELGRWEQRCLLGLFC